MNEADELADEILKTIDERVDGYELRLKSLEAHPIPTKGEKGDRGEPGAKGDQGDQGERGSDGMDGDAGPKGDAGDQGAPGKDGARGEDGHDGADCTDDQVMTSVQRHMLANAESYRGPKGDPGENGEKGDTGTDGPKGDTGEKGLQGEAGQDGEDGDDGEDCTDEMVQKSVAAHMLANADTYRGPAGPKGDAGEKGEPGDKGMDGVKGADGVKGVDGNLATLHVHGLLDPTKRYERGTFAVHSGGLVFAARATDAIEAGRLADAGWLVVLNGFASPPHVVVEDGGRTVTRTITMTDGSVSVETEKRDIMLDRGVFRAEDSYEKGDHVSYGGSGWIAQRTADLGRPGLPDSGWRLSTKAGRDGRDGAKGDKGDKGDKGRDLL